MPDTCMFCCVLQDHIHDVNAFVRSKTLQIWMTIVNEKVSMFVLLFHRNVGDECNEYLYREITFKEFYGCY